MKDDQKVLLFIIGLTSSLLLLAACTASTQPQAGGGEITGKLWELTLLKDNALVAGSNITAEFTTDGKLGGSSGCNRYGGLYTASGNSLQISSPLASTMMACAQELMDQESAYLSALGEVRTYAASVDQLVLYDANNKGILVYKVQSQALAGTSWSVIAYNNGKQAVTSVLANTNITIDFSTAGIVSGNGGCNAYSGPYTATGSQVKIGPLASTRKYCAEPAGIMEQETQFMVAMQTAATFKIEATTLDLRTAEGALAVQAAKADPVSATQVAPASTDSIQGIIWQWVSVSNKTTGETTTVPDPENYSIVFYPAGILKGKADCNNFTGTYDQENGLVITLGASTMAYCGDDSLDQQYLALLSSVVAGGPDGAGGLALENAGGEQRMLFINGGDASN